MSKPNLFHLLTTIFLGRTCLTGKLCHPWTSGCTDCCHWATRTLWLCLCCWSRCHDQTIFWTGFKDLSHIYVHGSQRPGATDTKNQGPAGEINHTKSGSTTNIVLQPDAAPVPVVDTITGTRTTSWACGWSFYYPCQYKGKLCRSLKAGSKHGWLREMSVVCR